MSTPSMGQVPKSESTSAMDNCEVYFYRVVLDKLNRFASTKNASGCNGRQMPTPEAICASDTWDPPANNIDSVDSSQNHLHQPPFKVEGTSLVVENLCRASAMISALTASTSAPYIRLDSSAYSLRYMRASVAALAVVHSTGLAFRHHHHHHRTTVKSANYEDKLPRLNSIFVGLCDSFAANDFDMETLQVISKNLTQLKLFLPSAFDVDHVQAYLTLMSSTFVDLRPQLALLLKFKQYLLQVYCKVKCEKYFPSILTLIHGDPKVDNFLFRKSAISAESDEDCRYVAALIDWQGASDGLISSDLMWMLYGYVKNLPDKMETVDSFLDYSIAYHRDTMYNHLKEAFNLNPVNDLELPEDDYDYIRTVKNGFLFDLMKIILVKPLVSISATHGHNAPFSTISDECLSETILGRNSKKRLEFIHLYFTIASELGVFHDLAKLCINAFREDMFSRMS